MSRRGHSGGREHGGRRSGYGATRRRHNPWPIPNRWLKRLGSGEGGLASQQQRPLPLTFEPERGYPLADVVVIETFPLDAQNSSGVLELAL